jgi:hypothetical protein
LYDYNRIILGRGLKILPVTDVLPELPVFQAGIKIIHISTMVLPNRSLAKIRKLNPIVSQIYQKNNFFPSFMKWEEISSE